MAADERSITAAVRSRLSYFKNLSSSLTFEGVRRLLETDLGLETFALDVHKKLIKKLLEENFYSSEDEDASGNVKENEVEAENSELESLEQTMKTRNHGKVKEPDNILSREQKQQESLTDKPDSEEHDQAEPKKVDNKINYEKDSSQEVSEGVIKEAVLKRASYLRAEIESISLGGVRRLLEQDLQLEKKALDVHKTLIRKLVDEVLTTPQDELDDVKDTNKKSQKKKPSKGNRDDSEEDNIKEKRSDTIEDSMESTEISRDNEEMKQNKETLKVGKSKKTKKDDLGSVNLKGRKRKKEPESEYKNSLKKPKKKKSVEDEDVKPLKSELTRRKVVDSENESEPPVENRASEDSDCGSFDSEEVKVERKKTVANPAVVHGEQVQHLKKIIKSCGMGVPPTLYKKAKQHPESKQEAYLIQELTAILKREGLSSNPTDKEIKAVKRRKERAKDLEGIDTTNIISDSRSRRATSNFFIAPPQYKVSNEDDEDSSDDEDNKSSEDDEPVIEEEESD